MIRKLFSHRPSDNEDDKFRAKFIAGFAVSGIILLAIGIVPYILSPKGDLTVYILSGLIAVLIFSLYLSRRGKVTASGWTIVVLGWLGIGFQAATADGVKDVIVVAYIALGLLASIVISLRAGTFVILTSIVVILGLGILEDRGIFLAREQDPIHYARDLSFVFITIATLIYFSTTSLREAVDRANKGEARLHIANQALVELNQTLEERVASRTAELESANERIGRRALQFEAIAQVAKAITSNQTLESLLPLLVEVASEKFAFYHVGIFLLDEQRIFAILSAANSPGGKKMLAQNHKIPIGQTSIVGFVAATGKPRIARNVGTDGMFSETPDLPDTRSEMALPLFAAGRLIGVLDIQSTEPGAFLEEDMEILATLADQIAIAIQNAQVFESTNKLLEDAQKATGSYLQQSWRIMMNQEKQMGYQISGGNLKPISPDTNPLFATKSPNAESEQPRTLDIPIRFADRIIGTLNIRRPEGSEWDSDDIDIAEAVADRLSLALESATLLQSTQRRAEIERITADISGKISSSTQFDSILRTTAEELSRALGGSEVLVQIQPTTSTQDSERTTS